ncbi:hypothetical protein [Klebsiella pneumoniae]|uniref:hypothetical protein n=1 Tax=Klebsiella pneumoniae TaxID=573 RepID=UPI0037BF3CFA
MANLVLLLIVALCLLQQWVAYRTWRAFRESRLVRRALFKGEAFAHRYLMWQRLYREILMTGGRKDVDY